MTCKLTRGLVSLGSIWSTRRTRAVRSTHSATRGCSNGTENCCSLVPTPRAPSGEKRERVGSGDETKLVES